MSMDYECSRQSLDKKLVTASNPEHAAQCYTRRGRKIVTSMVLWVTDLTTKERTVFHIKQEYTIRTSIQRMSGDREYRECGKPFEEVTNR